MDFGLMFFPSAVRNSPASKYDLLIEASKFADEHGFCCVWTPERHFHEFGGLFPNPSVTSSALAMITKKIQIRAGSLISPLHNTLRIAEEWSFVDNLSQGRVAISFGSGWNADDFVFFPERYADRQSIMYEQIDLIRKLWKGERIAMRGSFEKDVFVSLHPKPIQKELPIWVTSSGNLKTFISAGAIGANMLTHLIGQTIESLAEKIYAYRDSLERAGFDRDSGKVSLMLHTFMGPDLDGVKAKVRKPFREYLMSALSLEEKAAQSGGSISGGHTIDPHFVPDSVKEELLDLTFKRYFETAALTGTPETCKTLIWRLEEIGVDEIACLIDFLDDHAAILQSLAYVSELKRSLSGEELDAATARVRNLFTEGM
jgi:natural product biosynthesis luciferase-like monooxygenase protein